MIVFIRVDSSTLLGAGHVMRCLALAHDLEKNGAQVTFLCRVLPGSLISTIENQGFQVCPIRSGHDDAIQTKSYINRGRKPDWLVVDHYNLDHEWEKKVRPYVKRLFVIDDLANRSHVCDLLLDQNLYQNPLDRYKGLIPRDARLLAGPRYLLFREEFQQIRPRKREAILRRILISFGGTDPTNETVKAVKALTNFDQPFHVDIVVGKSHGSLKEIRDICGGRATHVIHEQINYIATLMNQADLAIGAGGTSTWERCLVGLPSITVEVADNQTRILTHLHQLGAIVLTGKNRDVNHLDLAREVKRIVEKPESLVKMSKACLTIMKDYEPGIVAREMGRMR